MHCGKGKDPKYGPKPSHNALNLALSLPTIPNFRDQKYTLLTLTILISSLRY